MMNLLRKLIWTQTTHISNLVKKTDYGTKIGEIENKKHYRDHGKYVATQEFNKFSTDNFAARLARAKWLHKAHIADFMIEKDFDDKLKNVEEKLTLNKIKDVLVQNESNKLLEKVKLISTKGLTKDLTNWYIVLNDAKYFSLAESKNQLIFPTLPK